LKVAIIRFSSLGDVILTSAVVEALFQNGIKPYFITFSSFAPLFEKDFRLSGLISVEKGQVKTVSDIKRFSQNLKEFDLILDLHVNLRSFLITKFSGVKTVRYDKKSAKRRLLTKPFFKKLVNLRGFNVVYAYLDTLKSLQIKGLYSYRPRLIIDESDRPEIDLPDRFVAIGAGARYKGKMYPFYDKVIKNLSKEGINTVLIGSKEDKESDKNIYDSALDLRGKLSLRQSLYVLSKASVVVSNDSAVSHMARAVKTKVLMIYGATHPDFGFAPLPDEGKYLFADLPCQPCDLHGKKECRFKDFRCFSKIEPEKVAQETVNLLQS